MSVLSDERAAIKDVLLAAFAEYGDTEFGQGLYGEGGELTVHLYIPDRVVPPVTMITPSDPYLERRDGDPFGTLTAHWEIWVIRTPAVNAVATEALDFEIEQQVEALTVNGFSVERVSEPFMYAVQNANYLTSVIHVTTGVTFKK